ncbi:unnamed protein product [Discula destructiva]
MESFTIGTGASIYSQKLLPAILSAQSEVILVTCFWAPSKSLTALSNTLAQLAARRASQQCRDRLRIRICFSSRSLFQKVFHTSCSDGYVYAPSTWSSSLGLPSPESLAAGNIDLKVKSLFFLPFSVMHPKFLIVDRQLAFAPSCNISWESWLEGCLELSRPASSRADDPIDGLLDFYRQVWEKDSDPDLPLLGSTVTPETVMQLNSEAIIRSPADMTVVLSDVSSPSPAIQWLPSWHHRNPAFCLFPWQESRAPDTPLNTNVLRLFAASTRDIYMQTPNLTSPPVLAAILDSLTRGVNIRIVTGRNMMVLEQLLTAFTTTNRCIKKLTEKYIKHLCESMDGRGRRPSLGSPDLEAQTSTPGTLTISYFMPSVGSTLEEEPVQSHLKLTIFDGRHTILGSGNMDRASWFTSQELGILVEDVTFATRVKTLVDKALEGRLDTVFPAPQGARNCYE